MKQFKSLMIASDQMPATDDASAADSGGVAEAKEELFQISSGLELSGGSPAAIGVEVGLQDPGPLSPFKKDNRASVRGI